MCGSMYVSTLLSPIDIQLIYNVVLVSGIQQSDLVYVSVYSYIYAHIYILYMHIYISHFSRVRLCATPIDGSLWGRPESDTTEVT